MTSFSSVDYPVALLMELYQSEKLSDIVIKTQNSTKW